LFFHVKLSAESEYGNTKLIKQFKALKYLIFILKKQPICIFFYIFIYFYLFLWILLKIVVIWFAVCMISILYYQPIRRANSVSMDAREWG